MTRYPETATKNRWLVRMHHRMRTVSLALMFVASGMHIAAKNYSFTAWALLALLFLVYPQLQYWRASNAADPVKAEMDNLLMDSVLLGVFMAALEFPLWLSFAAMIGIFGYLLVIGNTGFTRNLQLRRAREELRRPEQELLKANQALVLQLQEIEELQQQLRDQATRDALTMLYNRRYLDSTLERELASCKRDGKPLALVMMDVDDFKKYNDCYGHQAGDQCLISVAKTLQASAKRASDLAARYGGENFCWFCRAPIAVKLALPGAFPHWRKRSDFDI